MGTLPSSGTTLDFQQPVALMLDQWLHPQPDPALPAEADPFTTHTHSLVVRRRFEENRPRLFRIVWGFESALILLGP